MANFNFFPERTFLGSWKRSTQLSSDGYPKAKPGGAEFDWSTVTALAKATYLEDQLDVNRDPQGVRLAFQRGSTVPLGESNNIGVSAEWVEASGPFASGGFSVKVNDADVNAGETSFTVDALAGAVPAGTVLNFSDGSSATVTEDAAAGATTLTVEALAADIADDATAGVTTLLNAVNFADSQPASDEHPIPAGMKVLRYGTPIQRRASDGKFVLALTGGPKTKGDIYLVNETVIFDPSKSATDQLDPKSLYPIAIDGGRVFKDRLLYATHNVIGKDVDGADVTVGVTLTLAELEAALPGITYAIN